MHTGENKLRKDHTDIPCALSSMTELSVPLFNLFHEVFLMFYMSDTFFFTCDMVYEQLRRVFIAG